MREGKGHGFSGWLARGSGGEELNGLEYEVYVSFPARSRLSWWRGWQNLDQHGWYVREEGCGPSRSRLRTLSRLLDDWQEAGKSGRFFGPGLKVETGWVFGDLTADAVVNDGDGTRGCGVFKQRAEAVVRKTREDEGVEGREMEGADKERLRERLCEDVDRTGSWTEKEVNAIVREVLREALGHSLQTALGKVHDVGVTGVPRATELSFGGDQG